jgi:transferrin binding protein
MGKETFMKFAVVSITKLLVMTSLVGCSGGGDGGSGGGGDNGDSAVDFTTFSNMPDNGTTNFVGTAQSSTLEVTALGNGLVTMSDPSGPGAATQTMKNQDGNLVAVNIAADRASVSFNNENGGIFDFGGSIFTATSEDGKNYLLNINSPEYGLEFQTFGAWLTGLKTPSGVAGVGSFGAKTAENAVLVGTANYNGASIGIMRAVNGELFVTVSDVKVSTDFTTASMSSTSTSLAKVGGETLTSGSSIDFSGSGPVTGKGFTAQVTGVNNSDLTGSADGHFYGPTAEEVGGTFGLQTSDGQTYIGSFGGG